MYASFATASVSLPVCVVSCRRHPCNDALVLASPPSPHLNSERTFVERERGWTAAPPPLRARHKVIALFTGVCRISASRVDRRIRNTLTEVNVGH